jgi:hypothetical protein
MTVPSRLAPRTRDRVHSHTGSRGVETSHFHPDRHSVVAPPVVSDNPPTQSAPTSGGIGCVNLTTKPPAIETKPIASQIFAVDRARKRSGDPCRRTLASSERRRSASLTPEPLLDKHVAERHPWSPTVAAGMLNGDGLPPGLTRMSGRHREVAL